MKVLDDFGEKTQDEPEKELDRMKNGGEKLNVSKDQADDLNQKETGEASHNNKKNKTILFQINISQRENKYAVSQIIMSGAGRLQGGELHSRETHPRQAFLLQPSLVLFSGCLQHRVASFWDPNG